jgi:hypothetical protein
MEVGSQHRLRPLQMIYRLLLRNCAMDPGEVRLKTGAQLPRSPPGTPHSKESSSRSLNDYDLPLFLSQPPRTKKHQFRCDRFSRHNTPKAVRRSIAMSPNTSLLFIGGTGKETPPRDLTRRCPAWNSCGNREASGLDQRRTLGEPVPRHRCARCAAFGEHRSATRPTRSSPCAR